MISKDTKVLLWLSFWVIVFIWFHTGKDIYLGHIVSTDRWVKYKVVKPLYPKFHVGGRAKFMSTTTVSESAPLAFNDILYCEDPMSFKMERFSEQNTTNNAPDLRIDGTTIWPYSPIPNYETPL